LTVFLVDGKPIRVSVQPSVRARKTVEVEFRSRDELIVTLPYNKEVDLEALLEKHRDLIESQYEEFLEKKRILSGDIILYRGEPHKIEVLNDADSERVDLRDSKIVLHVEKKGNTKSALKSWLRSETDARVREIIRRFEKELGAPPRFYITDTSRWGFCKGNGEITFNWQLSCLPEDLAEFVIIHELVHLSVMNHQREFHTKMMKLMPNYRQREEKLDRYISIEPKFEFDAHHSFS